MRFLHCSCRLIEHRLFVIVQLVLDDLFQTATTQHDGYTEEHIVQTVFPIHIGGGKMPLVGGLYYLLLIGEVPTKEQAMEVEAEWAKRADVPDYVFKMIKSMPKETHSFHRPCWRCKTAPSLRSAITA